MPATAASTEAGCGPASQSPAADLAPTRDCLLYLRNAKGAAVAHFVPFEDAHARTGRSRYDTLPAFGGAMRINAYGTCLPMARESLGE